MKSYMNFLILITWSKIVIFIRLNYIRGFPDGSVGKASACSAGDTGDLDPISGLGRSPGGGNGDPLQYSCLENPMDREAGRATVQRVAKSQTRLSMSTAWLIILKLILPISFYF